MANEELKAVLSRHAELSDNDTHGELVSLHDLEDMVDWLTVVKGVALSDLRERFVYKTDRLTLTNEALLQCKATKKYPKWQSPGGLALAILNIVALVEAGTVAHSQRTLSTFARGQSKSHRGNRLLAQLRLLDQQCEKKINSRLADIVKQQSGWEDDTELSAFVHEFGTAASDAVLSASDGMFFVFCKISGPLIASTYRTAFSTFPYHLAF